MSGVNVKFALTGTSAKFSERSYRLYKVGFASANIVCAFAIIYMIHMNYMIYVNDAQLSGGTAIMSIATLLNLACTMPFYRAMNRDSKAGPAAEYISYLPMVNQGLYLVLCLLFFYNGYLRYGNA
jgi:hypothetical protein